ncbi:MAG: hypothetical protein IPJ77_22055 [Planctomycetes bacterium]|nr:hypothetical protein [Planctomycetota bacterium]
MPDSVHCSHCAAPFREADLRFCSYCGTERPTPASPVVLPPPVVVAPSTADRFAAAERHPSVPELLTRAPSTTKHTLNGACGVVFLAVFCVIAFAMAAAFLGGGAFGARTLRSNLFGVGGGLLALVPLAIAGVALAGFIVHSRRLSRFQRAELVRTLALVVDERVAVSGGKHASTTYFATLEGKDRQRREHRVDAQLAGRIAPNDLGMAYVKDDVLLDFQRIDV